MNGLLLIYQSDEEIYEDLDWYLGLNVALERDQKR